jgi:predicted metal-binding protein
MMAKARPAKNPARHLKDYRRFVKLALALGARTAKIVSPGDVATSEWVRWKCRYGCGGFSSNLVCPPNTPLPAETRVMLDGYRAAVLFETPSGSTRKIAVGLEREIFLSGYYKAFGMGGGPCELCKSCTFDEGCRHPEEARPAMEACGIDVFATARKHGFTIDVVRHRRDPQHYFGLVLIE